MNNVVNLCYEAGKYIFICPLKESDIRRIKTKRSLHRAHMHQMQETLIILEVDKIALYSEPLQRMYRVPDTNFRIHMNVPIAVDVMDYICPVTEQMHFVIFIEEN